ncbi:non-ribosomal peptide synthetase/type I polyketide synthase [Kutzneria chonburiensis]|uniref:Non-ribosomal peptide synthetase/type I polyketide synthase n=1 Tax=Kutzneria chonburiensis TaxID=1483604 RepID=A0ABV6MR55_9PSEU|nr:non-ribosomal peptide synthetase/type I polyketide synthase [Kutzneria chonburiensis]
MPLALSRGPRLVLAADEPRDAVAALLRAAQEFPENGVVTVNADGSSTRLPYRDLLSRSRRLLGGLRAAGVLRGDHVLLQGLPLADFFPAFWACVLGGAKPVAIADPVPSSRTGPVVSRVVDTWELLRRPIVVTDAHGVDALPETVGDRAQDIACLDGDPDEPLHRPSEDDTAVLMLSSGSTGAAKAVQLTHRALAEFAAGTRRELGITPSDTSLNWLPVDNSGSFLLYHVLEVFVGCDNVQTPTDLVLGEPLRWLDLVAEHRANHTWAPMFGYQLVSDALAAEPGRSWDLTCLRTLVSGGEQITRPAVARFLAATTQFGVPSDAFRPAWGMAETTTGITWGRLTADRGWHTVLKSSLAGRLRQADPGVAEQDALTFVSVGRPAPGAEVRVTDQAGAVRPEWHIGRLQVRGNRITPGYAEDPAATGSSFVDGWLDTGDLAYIADGEVVITGRAKDIVILNGHNHYCHEIEAVAGTVPGVTAAAAVGVPDDQHGTERLVVFVVAGRAIAAEVKAAVFDRLRLTASRVIVLPDTEFPRTSSGKVRRVELRERLLAGEYDLPANPLDTVRAVVRDLVGADVDDHTPFYELGLTSVTLSQARVRLAKELGMPVGPTVLFEHPTVAALAAHLVGDRPVEDRSDTDTAADDRIAIIGMAARFPGADNIDEFWANLRHGVDSVRVFTAGELADAGVPVAVTEAAGFRPVAGVLDDVTGFDAEFFGVSPREAELTAPAHRLFLQCCHHALEHGGYPAGFDGRIGVFAGSGMQLYGHQDGVGPAFDAEHAMQAAIGGEPDFLASRVAYRLGLTGPAIGVQTACSTSLVAVHLAVQALLTGDADLALAGAAAVRVPQERGYRHEPGSILSESGRCRTFDADADGTVGGNGVAAVLLKRLDQAIADGDTVHAVILGSAVNNDGASKVGFTAPGVAGQAAVVRAAHRRAGVAADSISYVEAHGTGTRLGDPIELSALREAFGNAPGTGFCAIGSVKPNIGHLDTCAGMAGLIKTVLMLRHGEIVPTLNFHTPNPDLGLEGSPFTPAVARQPWVCTGPRRAGVSAFGVGGTNAHVVLEQAPPQRDAVPPRAVVLPLSAKNPDSLARLVVRVADHLDAHPTLVPADLVTTLGLGRAHHAHRVAVVGESARDLAAALRTRPVAEPSPATALVFAFSGQGGSYPGMADMLRADFPAVRELLDRPGSAQVAQFALQVAQARVWHSFGIEPTMVVGHSIGELAALCVAGAFSYEDGLRFVTRRCELMASTAAGGMIAVLADANTARHIADRSGAEIAAVNGNDRHVLCGAPETMDAAITLLDREDIRWRRLSVDRAYHSSLMDPVLPDLRRAASKLSLCPLKIPVVSSLDGAVLPTGALLTPDHLVQHARRPVRFDLALATTVRLGAQRFLDLGPDGGVASLGRQALPGTVWHATQRRSGSHQVLPALADLYEAGFPVTWHPLATGGRRLPLPTYPFHTKPFPPVSEATPMNDFALAEVQALVGHRLGIPATEVAPDRTFLEQGADSLSMMALVRGVADRHGVQIPVRDLFAEVDTPRKLAALLPAPTAAASPAHLASVVVPAASTSPLEVPPAPPAVVTTTSLRGGASDVVRHLVERQLSVAEQLADLMRGQLGLLARENAVHLVEPPVPARQEAEPHRPQVTVKSTREPLPWNGSVPRSGVDFSLYFFGDYPDTAATDKYRLIDEAAAFADRHDFHALWLPERHFHSFGALFPNPSVLAAALAARTERVRLHAGSVVLPLHNPFRVAEEWAVVDNISHGRAGLCVASGWHANDFALAPENYGRHRELVYSQLETVRTLWAGGEVTTTTGDGKQVALRTQPRPIQDRPPLYVAVVGNPDSYRQAAENDLGVVTNLMAQTVEQLAENIALYRKTRAEHGLDPEAGRVVVLLHTFVGDDLDATRETAFRPFCDYLRSSMSLFNQVTNSLGLDIDLAATADGDVDFMLRRAYQRYCESRALIGTPDSCAEVIGRLLDAGTDEFACFVDFGIDTEQVLASLPLLDAMRQRHRPRRGVALTPAQRRIWFLDQLYPGQALYNEPKAIRFDGPLDLETLHAALRRVIDRHPALRAVVEIVDGEPRLVTQPSELDCPTIDCVDVDETMALATVLAEVGRVPFDLANGPLLRLRLLRFGPERHLLFLVGHHIVIDALSTQILVTDLGAAYRDAPLPPISAELTAPVPVDDGRRATDLSFWHGYLEGAQELILPTDRARPPVRSGVGASITRELAHGIGERLREFGARHRSTVFSLLLAALGVALSRLSGQHDIVFGTGYGGRPAGAEGVVGMFVDTVPLRVDLTDDPAFGDLAARVTRSSLAAYEHRQVSFDELVRELNPVRDPGRNPLFQIAVEFETEPGIEFAPEVTAELIDVASDRATMDVMIYLTQHADGVRCLVEYDTALFDGSTVQRLMDYVEHALRHGIARPAESVSALPLTAADRALLAQWQGEPAGAPTQCLHDLVADQARRTPDAVAIVDDHRQLTYRQLDERSDRIAGVLAARGIGSGALVGVCLPRGPELIAALVGVLKSGAGYLPLDAAVPPARIEFMLGDSGAVAVVTTERLLTDLPALATVSPVLVDELDDVPTAPVSAPSTPDSLAYCIYTSGSTGQPKGVLVPHRGPVNLVRWHLAEFEPEDTLQWASPSFDGSVVEIFVTLASGARLVLMDDETRYDPAAVADTVRRHGVQRLSMPFTPLKYLMATRPSLPSLRTLISAGEATGSTPALRAFLDSHPDCVLHNMYGPTEGSVCATAQVVVPGDPAPPIGRPVAGVHVRLLDDCGRPVPVGSVGEIHLGGACVSDGYVNRPAETAAAFVSDPQRPGERLYRTGDLARWRDGVLEYLGRTDDQVKVRGFRIELGEVTRALTGIEGVRDAAVVATKDDNGEAQLVGYVVGDREVADLAAALSDVLPGYSVPRRWVWLDELPVSANGKLDRDRLPEPATRKAECSASVGGLEAQLHVLWCEELDCGPVDVTSSFFDLGGHSLSAVRLRDRVRDRLGLDFPLMEFFRKPTISGLAALLRGAGTTV